MTTRRSLNINFVNRKHTFVIGSYDYGLTPLCCLAICEGVWHILSTVRSGCPDNTTIFWLFVSVLMIYYERQFYGYFKLILLTRVIGSFSTRVISTSLYFITIYYYRREFVTNSCKNSVVRFASQGAPSCTRGECSRATHAFVSRNRQLGSPSGTHQQVCHFARKYIKGALSKVPCWLTSPATCESQTWWHPYTAETGVT